MDCLKIRPRAGGGGHPGADGLTVRPIGAPRHNLLLPLGDRKREASRVESPSLAAQPFLTGVGLAGNGNLVETWMQHVADRRYSRHRCYLLGVKPASVVDARTTDRPHTPRETVVSTSRNDGSTGHTPACLMKSTAPAWTA